jgi:hypothetical protein
MKAEMSASQDPLMIDSQSQQYLERTRVWRAHETQLGRVVPWLTERIIASPDTTKKIAIVGNPTSMKGSLLGHGAFYLGAASEVQKALDDVGYGLREHYSSTAMTVKIGISRRWIKVAYGGSIPPDDAVYTSQQVDAALAYAEADLPDEEPDIVHLMLAELLADDKRDYGESTLKRHAGDPDAFVIFVPQNDKILRRGYRERVALWEGRKDLKRMFRAYGTVHDIAPEMAKLTMGSPASVRRIVERRNMAMYEAWRDKKFTLPITGKDQVPYEVLRENDPRELTGEAMEEFFVGLTHFTDKDVTVNPIREFLEFGYFENRAEELGFTDNSLILSPQNVEEVIYAPTGYLHERAIDLDKYIDRVAAEDLPLLGEVYTADYMPSISHYEATNSSIS